MVIRRHGAAHQQGVPVAQAEPAMVRIMQSDGTMKMEIRAGTVPPLTLAWDIVTPRTCAADAVSEALRCGTGLIVETNP